jgi:hypothetical protein
MYDLHESRFDSIEAGAPGSAQNSGLKPVSASNIGHEFLQRFYNGLIDGNSCGIFNTDLYRNGAPQ